MTVDEFKAELESLAKRIDEPLADAMVGLERRGQALSVDVIVPIDRVKRPANGHAIHLSLTAWFQPAAFTYESSPPI